MVSKSDAQLVAEVEKCTAALNRVQEEQNDIEHDLKAAYMPALEMAKKRM